MVDALIVLTLLVSAYSCWVRRDTWWSRWEIGASLAIVLEAGKRVVAYASTANVTVMAYGLEE